MPNTKTKKFDFQVFLAVFLILLVICCATVCIVVGNTENGVARASDGSYTISSNNHFYIKQFSTWDDLEKLSRFYFYNVPNLLEVSSDCQGAVQVGSLTITYLDNTNNTLTKKVPLILTYSQSVNDDAVMFTFGTVNNLGEPVVFQLLMGSLSTKAFLMSVPFSSPTETSNGHYYFDITSPMSANVWTKNFADYVFGSSNNVSQFTNFSFSIYHDYSLQCMLNITGGNFAIIPTRLDNSSQIVELQNQIAELQNEVNRLNGIVLEQREEIQYYETLLPNQQEVPFFDIERCKPSTFTYNGVTYSSDTITATQNGWDIYDSRYHNKELPPNWGVGFSLFLPETMNNTKFQISPFIQAWYEYTGIIDKLLGFSIGYRNQNGQVVKIGDYSNAPGSGTAEFVINAPTNEIVFFEEESNRLEMSKNMSALYYKVNTQVIYDEAYEKGIKHGYNYGYYAGKQDGIESANDYSFFSLFSAVFDAPITAIVGRWGDTDGDGVYEREGGMLNFYIPGLEINFAPFLLSMFTIAIIVLIIRFILARKS